MTRPVAKDYFLAPNVSTDPRQLIGLIPTARAITTIVDGEAIFRTLEEAIVDAEKSVLIAFWAMEPQTRLLSPRAKQSGQVTWADLLFSRIKKGVLVRVMMNDFDPGFKFLEHIFAWNRWRRLVVRADRESATSKMFQVLCVRHEAEIPAQTVSSAGQAGVYDKVADALNQEDPSLKPEENVAERAARFANGPGLWEKLEWQQKSNTVIPRKKGESYPAFPASHHQKMVIVDGRVAFTGGINLIDLNLDTPKHIPVPPPKPIPGKPPPEQRIAWHDVFVKTEGEPVQDLMKGFVEVWNYEHKRTEAFFKDALTKTIVKGRTFPSTTDLSFVDVPVGPIDQKQSPIPSQVHRTISQKSNNPSGVPDVVTKEILEGYLKAISIAQDFIYIENQYFREQAIADAIIAQHKKQSDLRTIIVLPKIAEELIKSQGDPITLKGASLQHKALDDMQKQIGGKLGVFCMVTGEKEVVVYVHSKLMIIDDVYACVGSPNANPRSFHMDTELQLAWYDKITARGLRMTLWAEILGLPGGMSSWTPKQFVDKWSDIARRNLSTAPKARKSFVIPFVNNILGLNIPLIPDEFT